MSDNKLHSVAEEDEERRLAEIAHAEQLARDFATGGYYAKWDKEGK